MCGLGVVALMAGCIQTHAVRATNSATVPRAASPVSRSEAPELGVARAAGARVRREWGPFVVFPTFLAHVSEMDPADEPPLNILETEASRRLLLHAFRAGGDAQMVDTLVYKDHRRLAALPDAALHYFSLAAEPVVTGDSAFVDVYNGIARKTYGPAELRILRYWFVRAEGVWHFVRRQLMWAT